MQNERLNGTRDLGLLLPRKILKIYKLKLLSQNWMICQFLIFQRLSRNECFRKKALDLSFGKVLDVGSGAGSHSLYLQNERKLEVTALDISPNLLKF